MRIMDKEETVDRDIMNAGRDGCEKANPRGMSDKVDIKKVHAGTD